MRRYSQGRLTHNGKNKVNPTVGILAVQGDYALHVAALHQIGAQGILVRNAEELSSIQGLILPGGESTTMLKFLNEEGLGGAILDFAKKGKPIFGTCAGAILLAKDVIDSNQGCLGLIDIGISRNAYGRQIESSIRWGMCRALSPSPVEMAFIRAPIIRRIGLEVQVLGECDTLPVLVEEKNCLCSTFHPELCSDLGIHRYFLNKVDQAIGNKK